MAIELPMKIAQYLQEQRFLLGNNELCQYSLLCPGFPNESSDLCLGVPLQKQTQQHLRWLNWLWEVVSDISGIGWHLLLRVL